MSPAALRIGIVSVSYLPRLGGAVTQTLLWHRYLTQRGHHVEVFCPDLTKHGRFEENGILVNRVSHPWVRSFHDNWSRLLLLNALRRAVQRRRADFDVFISPEFNIGPLSLCFTRGTRTIGTYGADLTFEYVNWSGRGVISYERVLRNAASDLGPRMHLTIRALNALQRFMFRRLDCVVAINGEDLRRIQPRARRTELVHCMVNDTSPDDAMAEKPRREPRVVSVVGRAVPWKRVPASLEFALKLCAFWPGLAVHYFGTGPELPQIEQRFGAAVTIHKELPPGEILKWQAQSDLTINLSEYETFCLVNAEAMRQRSLLVVRPLAEYADYLRDGENCLMLRAGDTDETALARVRDAFRSGQTVGLLDAAQRRIREQYGIETVGRQLEDLLRDIAAR